MMFDVVEKHGYCLPPSSGLLALFDRAQVFINYQEDTMENNSISDLDQLNRVAALSNTFISDYETRYDRNQFGLCSAANRSFIQLRRTLGADGIGQWVKESDVSLAAAGADIPKTYYARINSYPFETYPQYLREFYQDNLGKGFAPVSEIMPPGVSLRLSLHRPSVPDTFRFTNIFQVSEPLCGYNPSKEQLTQWRRFLLSDRNESPIKSFCVLNEITVKIHSIHLVYEKVTLPGPRQGITNYITRRNVVIALRDGSFQSHPISWDQLDHQPLALVFSFVRDK